MRFQYESHTLTTLCEPCFEMNQGNRHGCCGNSSSRRCDIEKTSYGTDSWMKCEPERSRQSSSSQCRLAQHHRQEASNSETGNWYQSQPIKIPLKITDTPDGKWADNCVPFQSFRCWCA